ncbi:hypothetical protein [Hallella colorans]|uniref:hypothetical protein n=1 Tax=Hallella colorans TaxID=1703337 RepID=UPI0023F437CE|nr:hypothetical protein [Hallella colorans]
MNKILRISVMTLLALVSSFTFAQVTFDSNVDKGKQTTNGKPDQVSKDGVTISCTDAALAAVNGKTKKGEYRFYASSSVTISADKNITKVEITCSKDKRHAATNFAPQDGLVLASPLATWTGKATSVTLKTTKQVRAFKVVVTLEGGTVTPPPAPSVEKAANIAAFKALPVNTVAELTLTNAQVLYTWTSDKGKTKIFVRDATGALMFYNTGLDLKANQTLDGTVTLKRAEFYKVIEAVKADATTADKLNIADGAAAEPKAITIGEAEANLYDLVKLTDVSIVKENKNFFAVSGADKMQIYDGFHLGLKLSEGEHQDIVGILSVYNGKAQIQPISAPIATGVYGVKVAHESDAPAYNMAGQRVGAGYKGVVIQNGKKFVRK